MEKYADILAAVREKINRAHSEQLSGLKGEEGDAELRDLIHRYLIREELSSYDREYVDDLTSRIFDDMACYGCITKYIADDTVEEINCNGWDSIAVVRNGSVEMPEEHFISPTQCSDITKRMVRRGGAVLDGTMPICDSYIDQGVRISAIAPPVIEESRGAAFSIRRQRLRKLTRESLTESGTALDEELEMLCMCINHGVSVGIAGSTGSGKTSDINFLLDSADISKRIFTIEDTRELNLDPKGGMRQVVYTRTRESSNEKYSVTADKLLRSALRFHPDIIVPAEMRGAEAMTAQEAGRTGHTIVTGFHADNAADAYTRIMTMCKMSGTDLSETTLMNNIVRAYPIMCFKAQLADGSRRYMRIIEATGCRDGRLEYRQLYRFIVKEVSYSGGRAVVRGEHRRMGSLSRNLATKLVENGALPRQVKKFAEDDWSPEEVYDA